MIRQLLRSQSACALAIGALLLLAYGCGPLDNKGSAGENKIPEVIIVNIPPDGAEFSTSPRVYWYGTDSDGRVIRYDYTVVTGAEVDSVAAELPGTASAVEKYIAFMLNDQYPRWTSIFVDSADIGELPTESDVRLFASPFPADCDTNYIVVRDPHGNPIDTVAEPVDCESDTIPQYFFLRAIDDQNQPSVVKYRTYKRRNHWPETIISARFNRNSEYISLRNRTATYSGIELIWGGSDRLDFIPPSIPFLEYHWRVYGPFPVNQTDPTLRPTLADTLGLQPVFESANIDPLEGVWVRDTTVSIYDLWRQADSRPDPLNDTTVTRAAWFMFVVTARDDAFIADETPASTSFRVLAPKFERKIAYIDDTWYGSATWANPSARSNQANPSINQMFFLDLLKKVYPEADTMQDFWWRSLSVPIDKNCNPPRVRCGNYLSMELLVRHKMVILVDDDIQDQLSRPSQPPAVQDVVRRYLDAGGMVWILGRHSFIPQSETCQSCRERMFDLCAEDTQGYSRLACGYFDMEGMWYPGFRGNAMPVKQTEEELPRPPSSNDEFIGASLVASGSGLPERLEIDRERVDSMFFPAHVKKILDSSGTPAIIGVPDVNFMVLGPSTTPLYIFESWRPGGPIPPTGVQSFMHHKPVSMRRVGPSRETPLYKTAFTTFPLYFIKQDQAEEYFIKMVEWFFLPFSQS